jgi:hypothetical protein
MIFMIYNMYSLRTSPSKVSKKNNIFQNRF